MSIILGFQDTQVIDPQLHISGVRLYSFNSHLYGIWRVFIIGLQNMAKRKSRSVLAIPITIRSFYSFKPPILERRSFEGY
jgi:hypothetical protein